MKLPRMTTRRWMIAVAVVGVLLGVLVRFFPPQREDSARMVLRSNYFLTVSVAGYDVPLALIVGLGLTFLGVVGALLVWAARGERPQA